MESDRMGHLLGAIDQAQLDEQRGVVQNEKRQGENQPYGVTEELIVKGTDPAGHPYSWTVIGSMEDLNAASLEDVKEWFRPTTARRTPCWSWRAILMPTKLLEEGGEILWRYPLRTARGATRDLDRRSAPARTGRSRRTACRRRGIYKVWNIPPYGAR